MEQIIDSSEPFVYTPKAALIAYESNTGRNNTYLELRPIFKDGTMGEAKPVSHKFITDICAGLSENYNHTLHGEIPSNVIFCDPRKNNETIVWYNPPMKRERFFVESLGIENGTYHVPGTIYMVNKNHLFVYCFAGRKATLDTPLLKGPYFNTYEDGKICTGSANTTFPEYSKYTFENVTKFWEGVFWKSYDAHTIGESPSTKHNLIETIKKYKEKPFDTSELVPYAQYSTMKYRLQSLGY